MSTEDTECTWRPAKWTDGESTADPVFGEYHLALNNWSSRWQNAKGDTLTIIGSGHRPSKVQTDTWRQIGPRLDDIMRMAVLSLPPWPKKRGYFAFWEKPLEINVSTPTLELFDDGRYTLLFQTNKKLDDYDTCGLIEMKEFQIIESEWSC
jgi:hypothetical protein